MKLNRKILSLFYMFRMLAEKTIKHVRVITVSGTHMGLLCMTKLALYTLLALDQSEWIRAQDVDLTRLRQNYSLNFQFHACILYPYVNLCFYRSKTASVTLNYSTFMELVKSMGV